MIVLSDTRADAAPGAASQLPRVSIVLPAYKAEATIEDTVAALASQTYTAFEVVVVDDASPDATGERACHALRRTGLRHVVVRLAGNAGPSGARNVGVSLALGEYVAFQDADDTWLPEKLARQVELMDRHPEVTLCGCEAEVTNLDGSMARTLFRNLPLFQEAAWKLLLLGDFIPASCAMARRSDLGTHPFNPALRAAEGRDVWIRLASNGVTAVLQDALVRTLAPPASALSGAALAASDTKRVVDFHVGAMRDYMTWRERHAVYGSLHSSIGRDLAARPGHYLKGARHTLTAIGMGFNVASNLKVLVLSNPAIRKLRLFLDGRQANLG